MPPISPKYGCAKCERKFASKALLYAHEITDHPTRIPTPPEHEPMAKQKQSKGPKGAAPKPTKTSTLKAAAESGQHQPYGPGGIRWEHRSDVGTIAGEVYQVKFTEETWERFENQKDPTKRNDQLVKLMRVQPGVKIPAKAQISETHKYDLETISRICNGVPRVGSRGKTIEQVAAEKEGN